MCITQLLNLISILEYNLNLYVLITLVVHPFVVGTGLNGVNVGSVLERISQVLFPFAFVSLFLRSIRDFRNAIFLKLWSLNYLILFPLASIEGHYKKEFHKTCHCQCLPWGHSLLRTLLYHIICLWRNFFWCHYEESCAFSNQLLSALWTMWIIRQH